MSLMRKQRPIRCSCWIILRFFHRWPRPSTDNPAVAQRFEFFIAGMEVGNAYSELNDPQEQYKRLVADLDDDTETGNRIIDEDFVQGPRIRHAAGRWFGYRH